MGVDIKINGLIGFYINKNDIPDEDDNELYLSNLIGDKYDLAITGSYYIDDEEFYYIGIKNIKPLNTLEDRLSELKEFLINESLIKEDSEYDLHITKLYY